MSTESRPVYLTPSQEEMTGLQSPIRPEECLGAAAIIMAKLDDVSTVIGGMQAEDNWPECRHYVHVSGVLSSLARQLASYGAPYMADHVAMRVWGYGESA